MPRLLTALLLALGLALVAAAGTMRAAEDPTAWVRQRVRDVDLTESERRWESIGWVRDMGVALELSKRHGRPIFILAAAGALDGRC